MGKIWNTACSMCPPLFSSASFLAPRSSFLFVSSPEVFTLASEPFPSCNVDICILQGILWSLLICTFIYCCDWASSMMSTEAKLLPVTAFKAFEPLSKQVSNVLAGPLLWRKNSYSITVSRINSYSICSSRIVKKIKIFSLKDKRWILVYVTPYFVPEALGGAYLSWYLSRARRAVPMETKHVEKC